MFHQFKIIIFTIATVGNLCSWKARAQAIQLISSYDKTSIRGLSVVDERIIWVSGSNGTIGRSVDSGNTFKWMTVKGYEKTDFRDIEAFDDTSAIVMGTAAPAYILRTTDGGETWKIVFENNTKGMFLDAMEFWNRQNGIVIGDPINSKFFIARTTDGGMNWRNIPTVNIPVADSGEACFASSGTNIKALNREDAVFVSGGLRSNLYTRHNKLALPVAQGKETTGANSIAVKNKHIMVVVGGDFNSKESTTDNCFLTRDGGNTWIAPEVPPHGYRSCVEWLGKNNWISCGLNGVDYTKDECKTWKWISKESFHVCRKAKNGKTVFFAGSGGRIGKLVN